MPIRFSLPGTLDALPHEVPSATKLFEDDAFQIDVKAGVRVEETRAASLAEVVADEDDVIELTFDDGVVFCVPASVLRDDVAPAASRSGGDGQAVAIPPRIAFGPQTRGIGDWALRALRVLGVNLAADLTAAKLVQHVEEKLDKIGPGPGLYHCPAPNRLGPRVEGLLPGDQPLLLFLHGTASHTQGSFGGLLEGDNASTWEEIQTLYRHRVYALEHRTLSQSPVENAIEVAEHLPIGARLHLVTHSRGGLIGELLCRGPRGFDDVDLRQFEGDAWRVERERLVRLRDLLAKKKIRIDRFVRVACPARGTTLASRRLDRYLSLILNAIGLIPALSGNPLYGWVKSLLIAVAKKRACPEDLPGLEAQMPESRLIKILNRQDEKFAVEADLTVIAGDIEGSGLWRRLAVLATDLFYREDHDLVVNTWAMTGGGRRFGEDDARYAFDQGSEVSHFNYFRNPRTVGKLVAALRSEEERQREFLPLPKERQPLVVRSAAPAGPPKDSLFLLPGIMGSRLAAGGDRIWLDLVEIAGGKLGRLQFGKRVKVDGPMPEYDAISNYLGGSHDILPFAFDWRLSVFAAADLLAEAVQQRLETSERPIRFLAHSMGGLVVRALIAAHQDLWARVTARPGARFVMLGTPNLGSYAIPHILLGREPIFRQLALLDLTRGRNELAEIVGAFPGLLDMLPIDPQAQVFSSAWWKSLAAGIGQGWPIPKEKDLEQALANRQRLERDGQPDPRYSVYVAGVAPQTPWGIAGPAAGRIDWRGTSRGDGRVTWASGIPPEVPTWYMKAEHGRMATHPPAFLALQELLVNGTTERLPREAPQIRAFETDFPLPEARVELFPDRTELAAAALGYEPEHWVEQEEPQLKVSIKLGDLIYARFPVVVGHYRNDGIYSAEAVLDARLGGQLSRRYNLGIYPTEVGSSLIVLDSSCQPPGTCVVGLGEVGGLSPGSLTQTVTRAVVSYVAELKERQPWVTRVGLSSVLIGSGEAGLTVRDSIAAILRGVVEANRRLAETPDLRSVVVREVELVERMEDVAICAARSLCAFESRQTIPGGRLTITRELARAPGFRRQIPCGVDDSWWRRLGIEERPDGTLVFVSLTDRARLEETLQATQPQIAQRLVDRAVASSAWNPRGAHTLFSLLVPNAIKTYVPDDRSVVLLLDPKAARFPWELLADATTTDRPPFSVRAGVVRQLRSPGFRPQPLAATGKAALVIGDPRTENLPPLDSAREEAADIARLLRPSFEPVHLDRPTPEEVLDELFRQPYRILHLAGHGVLREEGTGDRRLVAGLALDCGLMLTAREIKNLVALPDLVVINCCHVGKIPSEGNLSGLNPPLFAASLAQELIDMGVRAVVAAGWAIDDAAARTFALGLYEMLLSGKTYGEAVHEARRLTYSAHRATNTWGAFQCYGDPGFRLVLADRRPSAPLPTYVDPCELVLKIENLLSSGNPVTAAAMTTLIQPIESSWPKWLFRADVAALLAKAYLAAGEAQKSADQCRIALRSNHGALPFDVLETLIAAVAAGAELEKGKDLEGLLAELEWMERLAPAPSRTVHLALIRSAQARNLKGKKLAAALERIEAMLCGFEKQDPDVYLEGLLALTEVRFLVGEQKPRSGDKTPLYRLLERLRSGMTKLSAQEPIRARPLALRLAVLERLVDPKTAPPVDETLITACSAPTAPVAPGLVSALALARHALDPKVAENAGLSQVRIRQRQAGVKEIESLEARLLRQR